MESNTQYIQEDQIDLQELWKTLAKRKLFIISLTLLFTLGAVFYSFITKPVYEGNALIEIGEAMITNDHEDTKLPVRLNEPEDLKEIVTTLYKKVDASIPSKATNTLQLSYQDPDPTIIKQTLHTVIDEVIKRHKKKAQWYSNSGVNVYMSQVVGEITVSKGPVKPKKPLIISLAFIIGMMFSVFLAFFLEFLQGVKKEEN